MRLSYVINAYLLTYLKSAKKSYGHQKAIDGWHSCVSRGDHITLGLRSTQREANQISETGTNASRRRYGESDVSMRCMLRPVRIYILQSDGWHDNTSCTGYHLSVTWPLRRLVMHTRVGVELRFYICGQNAPSSPFDTRSGLVVRRTARRREATLMGGNCVIAQIMIRRATTVDEDDATTSLATALMRDVFQHFCVKQEQQALLPQRGQCVRSVVLRRFTW